MISQLSGTLGQLGISRKPVSAPQPTGWWLEGGINPANCMCAYQAKGAASYAQSLVNLNSPNDNTLVVKGTAPTNNWDSATGWYFDGNYAFDTGVIFQLDYTAIVDFTCTTNRRYALGTRNVGLYEGVSGLSNFIFDNSTFTYNPNTGMFSARVLAINKNKGYHDGIYVVDINKTTLSAPLLATYIGAKNNFGNPISQFAGNIRSCCIYNTILTDAQILAVSTAMKNL